MIKTFADRQTEELFRTGKAKKVPADVARRALRKLEAIDAALPVSDLKVPPGNRLHALKGDRAGQHAISVNDQWRICLRFADGDAYDVEFRDYHQQELLYEHSQLQAARAATDPSGRDPARGFPAGV